MSENLTFKILTLGESGVGKTCILRRYVEDKFNKNHLATIGIDFKTKSIPIGDKIVRLKIWDTAGQERFRNITKQYFKEADGILLIYDVTDNSTFEKTDFWIKQITQNTQYEEVALVLIGNKTDIEPREVSMEMGSELAKKYNLNYFETSALNGSNIAECIECLTQEVIKKKKIEINPALNDRNTISSVSLDKSKTSQDKQNKRHCC